MPTPATPAAPTKPASELLRDARWMAGLTQAEVAQRAGISRQVISDYERGNKNPSVETLDRLLIGCGMRLRLAFVPEPGLEDWPTRDLLELALTRRLEAGYVEALGAIASAVGDSSAFLVSGKAGARLHGACVRVRELELWLDDSIPLEQISDWLNAAGLRDGEDSAVVVSRRSHLREGVYLTHALASVKVRAEPQFRGCLKRSREIELDRFGLEPFTVGLVAASECATGWYHRDRDHLALQRAIRISADSK